MSALIQSHSEAETSPADQTNNIKKGNSHDSDSCLLDTINLILAGGEEGPTSGFIIFWKCHLDHSLEMTDHGTER